MKTPDIVSFTVVGAGRFPFDMLRYDACWPVSGDDAAAIALNTGEMRARASRRAVRLSTVRRHTPTLGRWSSFGWTVVSHDANGCPRDDSETAEIVASLVPPPEV
jgi:hypothetical protein